MRTPRILPGAAGIIALTAAIGFVDGPPENEGENISRGKITLVSAQSPDATDKSLPGNQRAARPGNPAYLVELKRGERTVVVLIDAITGQIISA